MQHRLTQGISTRGADAGVRGFGAVNPAARWGAAPMAAPPAASRAARSGTSPPRAPKCQARKADVIREGLWLSNHQFCMLELDSLYGACRAF